MKFCTRVSATTLLGFVLSMTGAFLVLNAGAAMAEPANYQQLSQNETPQNNTPQNNTQEKAQKKLKKKDKTECKRVTVTGSHFKKKVCMKQSKWAELERESREAADRLQDQSGLSGS